MLPNSAVIGIAIVCFMEGIILGILLTFFLLAPAMVQKIIKENRDD